MMRIGKIELFRMARPFPLFLMNVCCSLATVLIGTLELFTQHAIRFLRLRGGGVSLRRLRYRKLILRRRHARASRQREHRTDDHRRHGLPILHSIPSGLDLHLHSESPRYLHALLQKHGHAQTYWPVRTIRAFTQLIHRYDIASFTKCRRFLKNFYQKTLRAIPDDAHSSNDAHRSTSDELCDQPPPVVSSDDCRMKMARTISIVSASSGRLSGR